MTPVITKIYDLVGGGASFVLLAPVSERDFSFIFLFITYSPLLQKRI